MVPATLTVTFQEVHRLKIAKLDRPGLLRLTNDNDRPVRFLYGNFEEPRPDGRTRVFANDSVVIRVHRQKIDWIAFFVRGGGLLGIGHVRGIELPGNARLAHRAATTFTKADLTRWAAQR